MVLEQIERRGVRDPRVLEAMRAVPRRAFVPDHLWEAAFADQALPIGQGQTISQPYVVARMTELLALAPEHRVLEIGTGSGYQAAILAHLAKRVYSVEIVPTLAASARRKFEDLGIENIEVRCGDGSDGWPEEAPFDRVCVTAAPVEVPPAIPDQLALGGRMVVPVGKDDQILEVWDRREDGFKKTRSIGVRFVPMTGRALNTTQERV